MNYAYCFDLDGTVTKEEMLPILSREIGMYDEIKALTDATIKGEIPFRESFLLRCKMLESVPVSRVQKIVSRIPINEKIANFIRENSHCSYVITGNLDIWIEPLVETLGCQCYSSRSEVLDDKVVKISQVLCKGETIRELRKQHDKIIAVGDGMGDVPMFEEADVCIAYAGVHPPAGKLLALSHYVAYEENALLRLLKQLTTGASQHQPNDVDHQSDGRVLAWRKQKI